MDKGVARILDANFNRSRESLRVMEDYARFVLNNGQLSGTIKQARHKLREIIEALGGTKLLHGRNTPGDVGTELNASGEMKRTDTTAVVTAACKRVVEGLRVMEEFSKTIPGQAGRQLEQIRYQCYEWEVQLLSRGQNKKKLSEMRLYVLISSELCKKNPLEVARDVLNGGADAIQLREKKMDAGEYLVLAEKMAELCRQENKLFIVNDRPDIAVAAKADGVHLGQKDLKIAQARTVLSSEMVVGVSTHNIEQAKQAVTGGADYIGVGPVFATGTKPSAEPVGVEYVRQVAKEIDLPWAAIGGINLDNLAEVVAAGAKCVAACSAIICSEDPAGITAQFTRRLR
ncbi:MAG: thiamine phosphate synthase [Actinobacteria bacterium]|nr:thiamine phosphate synthase [Actinomycetota bacterium]